PTMYSIIENHPSVRESWAKTLIGRKTIELDLPEELVNSCNIELHSELESLDVKEVPTESYPGTPPPGAAKRVKTAVSSGKLRSYLEELTKLPKDFTPHPKLERTLLRKRKALENPNDHNVDWAMAEEIAFASILADGTAIRLTGQDTERGTFSHRHGILHDVKNGNRFIPLQSLPQAKAAFEVHNSPLSENAALGFEYGYNIQEPRRLVIWEAQYGDFINGAQVIIDEFLVSARAKWGQTPSLVLLLPHAYEGQGPDHSSARVERFLESTADINMRVANCTTAAQYFHLLRRQAALLRTDPLPLIILTPKSLLRHTEVASPFMDLSEGTWQPVIDDSIDLKQREMSHRLIICTGKVYVDLKSSEHRAKTPSAAIVRLEQLYPLPNEELKRVINSYPKLSEIVWLQEEPENMGAWTYIHPRLKNIIDRKFPLYYMGRSAYSSPAEGSLSRHRVNQETLINQAFNPKPKKEINDIICSITD
ncbi:MAG: 2-oxoglutarate dehydrogenase E1 component, partial [Thermodesulfobacteriota bacterium]